MINAGKRSVLGVRVDVTDYESVVERTVAAARGHVPLTVTALPVHGIMTGALDSEHRYRLNSFDLLVPDGQPVRWALNLIHRVGLKERVYGPLLMLALCEQLAKEKLPIYLYGSREETTAKLQRNLERRFPGIAIVGRRAGRYTVLTADQRSDIVETIKGSGASLVFAGLGCPRQEIWAYENRSALSMPIVCVGAGFDFHAGTVAQAPIAIQNLGLEWAYRLSREPRRLWRRYAVYNPMYIGMVVAQLTGAIDFDATPATRPSHDLNYG